jgi:Sec-independent protein secretion pathway component TatC
MLAIPMIVLYELGIFAARFLARPAEAGATDSTTPTA